MLNVVYRSYGGENRKGRPEYYSKLIALLSFVRAIRTLHKPPGRVIYLNDGPIPPDRLSIMKQTGEVLSKKRMGMKASMRAAISLSCEISDRDEDIVWLAEDDYLYKPESLNALDGASSVFDTASYFGLYALIGKRQPNGKYPDDDRIPEGWQEDRPVEVNGHPWRKALSTTSTFGGRVGAFRRDRLLMMLAMQTGGAWDHTTCLGYQGYRPFTRASLFRSIEGANPQRTWLRRTAILALRAGFDGYVSARASHAKDGLLVASDPALITHLETALLAEGTDWAALAAETHDWARDQGLVG